MVCMYMVVNADHYVSRFIIVYQIFEPKSWIYAEAIIFLLQLEEIEKTTRANMEV